MLRLALSCFFFILHYSVFFFLFFCLSSYSSCFVFPGLEHSLASHSHLALIFRPRRKDFAPFPARVSGHRRRAARRCRWRGATWSCCGCCPVCRGARAGTRHGPGSLGEKHGKRAEKARGKGVEAEMGRPRTVTLANGCQGLKACGAYV